MSTLASIYLTSLNNSYRHTYLARIGDPTVTVLRKSEIPPNLTFSVMKWKKISLPQMLRYFHRLHACGT